MVRLALAVLTAIAVCVAVVSAHAERRVALVVGNKNYKHTTVLDNTIHDAEDVTKALRKVDFKVIPANDVDLAELRAAIQQFARESRGADVSLFYYSGHGMQWEGENMIVPTDATFEDAELMPFELVPLREVMSALSLAAKAKIIILDACRDNEAERSLKIALAKKQGKRSTAVDRGLVKLDATRGQVVVFATQPDRTASDAFGSSSRNSPFTHAFLEEIEQPGVEIGRTFRKVAARVDKLTGGAQLPEISISLLGDFYFKPDTREASGTTAADEPTPEVTPSPTTPDQIANDYKLAERINSEAAWNAFLAKYAERPDDFYMLLAREARNKLAVGVFPDPDASEDKQPEEPSKPADTSKADKKPGRDTSAVRNALAGLNFSGGTIEAIRARGSLQCGVSTGLVGFSAPDNEGNWTGLDVDMCRAVAAGILGDADLVDFKPLTPKVRFTALLSGEIDILSRNTTWSATRDTALGLNFASITYYDGQGFMVPTAFKITSARELDGAAVCVQAGTTTELFLTDYFRANNMRYDPVFTETYQEQKLAYEHGRCDVLTTDASALHSIRATFSVPESHMVLPEIISKEPLGVMVRHGDPKFELAVKWIINAVKRAEELGLTSANIDERRKSGDLAIDLFASPGWTVDVIRQVGNYSEIFERNVGPNTPLGINRGLNALWSEGGLMAPASMSFDETQPPGLRTAEAPSIDSIKVRGKLVCGISNGFDADMCRAVSIAIFGEDNVELVEADAAIDLVPKLHSGKIDLIGGSLIPTILRADLSELTFPAGNFFDGPALMVKKSLGVKSVGEMSGALACLVDGSESAEVFENYFRRHRLEFTPKRLDTFEAAAEAYIADKCDTIVGLATQLAELRKGFKNSDKHDLLPELLSIHAAGPAVLSGNDRFADIVRWVVFALISAEELGLSSGNISKKAGSGVPDISRILGEGYYTDFGSDAGLETGWAGKIIAAVGNYGEVFDRNLGSGSDLGLPRGINTLWNKGGLLYSPPIR